MKSDASKPLRAVLVCAHSIWNVPPLYNVAKILASAGIETWVIGYQADDLKAVERLGLRARIVRFTLRSRKIPIGKLRKLLATFEFLRVATSAIKRLNPDLLITFNEPASLILPRCSHVPLRIAWALEYAEFEFQGFMERALIRWSIYHWSDADWFVAPTVPRLALHMGLKPSLLSHRTFIVHNTALMGAGPIPDSTVRGTEARNWLEKAGQRGWLRVVYAGAVGNRYAIDRLIQAMDAEPQASLLILGKKHQLSLREVEDARSKCASNERFLWLDEIPYAEMQSLLPLADVGFAHYLGDTLNARFSAPGKLYEYLRAGLILLTDEDCCLRAEVGAADCGAFFPAPATISSIQNALEKLVRRRSEIAQMKTRSRVLFQTHFNMEIQMQTLIKAIRDRFENQPSL